MWVWVCVWVSVLVCVCACERESERVGRKAVLRMHLSGVSEARIMVRSWAQSNIKGNFLPLQPQQN